MIQAEQISKRFYRMTGEANFFYAVEETDLTLESGTLTMVMGRSGSGKTTLLHMLAGLQPPTTGNIIVEGTSLYAMPDGALSRFRNEVMGVIPQGQTPIASLTVWENVTLPGLLYATDAEKVRQRGMALLQEFGMENLANVYPGELSGGELRRMAIARGLVNRPRVVLADEPTGDLDDENTRWVLEALRRLADEGATVLVVTHESEAAMYADRVLHMNKGVLSMPE